MTAAVPRLQVTGLRAGFGPTTVLHGVDLEVPAGTVAAVLGLNGAGKSVTMKVVAGLVPAWDGTVRLDGEDLTTAEPEDRVGAGVSHVTQGRQLFPELTVEENLRLGAYSLRRRNKARYGAVLDGVYERFPRLRERRGQLAGTMSGGEQAMLAVGRALMAEPRIILIDEPTAGLAPRIVDDLLEILRQVRADGVTMLLVEQHVHFALDLADTVHIMRRGQIVHAAATADLDRERLVSELGIGRLLGAQVDAAGPRRRPPSRGRNNGGGPPRRYRATERLAQRQARLEAAEQPPKVRVRSITKQRADVAGAGR